MTHSLLDENDDDVSKLASLSLLALRLTWSARSEAKSLGKMACRDVHAQRLNRLSLYTRSEAKKDRLSCFTRSEAKRDVLYAWRDNAQRQKSACRGDHLSTLRGKNVLGVITLRGKRVLVVVIIFPRSEAKMCLA